VIVVIGSVLKIRISFSRMTLVGNRLCILYFSATIL